jgi:hypothetical protein
MVKMNEPFLDSHAEHIWSNRELDRNCSDSEVYIPDCHRVAQLLRVLRELDESVPGLEALPEAELSDLVYSAIRESGFVDPIEGGYAIAAVLEVIETQAPECRARDLGKFSQDEINKSLPCATFLSSVRGAER